MKANFEKLICDRKLERIDLIKSIESILIKQRGFVFQMPPPGSAIVASLSGGADSIISTAILMEDYKLKVYPYYVRRGARAQKFEEESVDYFSIYFRSKYPSLYQNLIKLDVPIPAREVKNHLPLAIRSGFGYPLRNSLLLSLGVQYASSLQISENECTHTVFSSIVSSDADQTMHSTLTALRSLMLHVCTDMGNWQWQIASLAMEPYIGNYFDKDILLKRAIQLGLPLEKTRTCIESSRLHCGICPSCSDRKRAFKETCIEDKTEYINRV